MNFSIKNKIDGFTPTPQRIQLKKLPQPCGSRTRLVWGFTAVELLVSVALFTIIIAITSGVFIRSLRTQRAIVSFIAANNNASLTIEQLAREIRTGQTFCTGANSGCALVSGAFKNLTFTNAKGEKVKYELSEPQQIGSATIQSILRSVNDGTPIALTADNVNIKNLSFYLLGQDAGDNQNPRITIALSVGATGIAFSDAIINLQTTISSRVLQD
jgi:type II secretory pathway pseudopilin PulG